MEPILSSTAFEKYDSSFMALVLHPAEFNRLTWSPVFRALGKEVK